MLPLTHPVTASLLPVVLLIAIGYLAGRPAWMVTALCADGGTFTVRVTPPDQPENGPDEDAGETPGGGLRLPANRAVRTSP